MGKHFESVPLGWAKAKLGDLGKWTSGGTPLTKNEEYYKNGNIPWVVTGDLNDGPLIEISHKITELGLKNSAAKLFPEGTLLVAMYGATIGKLGVLCEPAATNQACAALISSEQTRELIPYVFYFLLLQQENLKKLGQGGAQPNISQTLLRDVDILIAPLNEQKRIVDRIEKLFSDMDKGEALLKTVQKQLATYRQSVLKAAITGELTKDWREQNKRRLESGEKLLSRILESRRKNWQGRGKHKEILDVDTSDLPDLPDGWAWATPEHLADDAQNALSIGPFGSNLKVDDYTDAGIPLVFVRHIRAKSFDGLKPQYVSEKKAKELSAHKVIGGDLLITKMGEPPGDVCIYPETAPEGIITADCIRFSHQRTFLDTKYLELALSSRPVQTQIQGITKGVAQQKVTLGNFKRIAIPLPGREEQIEISNICVEKFSQIEALEMWCATELSRNATLRQSILKSAFSGKLVPQDARDEPASELLKRIQSGKATVHLSRGSKARSDKSEAA